MRLVEKENCTFISQKDAVNIHAFNNKYTRKYLQKDIYIFILYICTQTAVGMANPFHTELREQIRQLQHKPSAAIRS